MNSPTYEQIASDFRLWGEYFDTNAEMTEAEFAALSPGRRVGLLIDALGIEGPRTTGRSLAAMRHKHTRPCAVCGASFTGLATKRTCSDACRSKLSRANRK